MQADTMETPADDHERIDALLDQLIPRPGPPWRRFATGLVLTVMVLAVGLSWMLGYAMPRPEANTSYSGGNLFHYVPERNALAVSLFVPNSSQRDVRLTAVTLDAPGLHLVEAGASLREDLTQTGDCHTEGGIESCVSAATPVSDDAIGPWPRDVAPLPFTLPAGREMYLYLLVEPTSCRGPSALPWGNVDATFDFGPGALPPWSNTERLDNPLVDQADDARLMAANGDNAFEVTPGPESSVVDVSGLLAAACQLTGRS